MSMWVTAWIVETLITSIWPAAYTINGWSGGWGSYTRNLCYIFPEVCWLLFWWLSFHIARNWEAAKYNRNEVWWCMYTVEVKFSGNEVPCGLLFLFCSLLGPRKKSLGTYLPIHSNRHAHSRSRNLNYVLYLLHCCYSLAKLSESNTKTKQASGYNRLRITLNFIINPYSKIEGVLW